MPISRPAPERSRSVAIVLKGVFLPRRRRVARDYSQRKTTEPDRLVDLAHNSEESKPPFLENQEEIPSERLEIPVRGPGPRPGRGLRQLRRDRLKPRPGRDVPGLHPGASHADRRRDPDR